MDMPAHGHAWRRHIHRIDGHDCNAKTAISFQKI